MLMIRLQRIGKKKSPSYRVVISEKSKDTQGNSLEILGRYNPAASPKILELNEERIKYWLARGARTSETVHNFLVQKGILSGAKRKSVTISDKRKAKIEEKNKAKQKKESESSESKEKEKESGDNKEPENNDIKNSAEEKKADESESKGVDANKEQAKEQSGSDVKQEDSCSEKPKEEQAEDGQ